MKNVRSYDTLEDIITELEKSQFPELVWVGKNYSKEELINDLRRIRECACPPVPGPTW
jgi:hypothetical protein